RHVWIGSSRDEHGHPPHDHAEHRRATWRSGRVADQARRGCERFRRNPSWSWRHARPHRRAAVCRSAALVLRRVARDAVTTARATDWHRLRCRRISIALVDHGFETVHSPLEVTIAEFTDRLVEQAPQRKFLLFARFIFAVSNHLLEPG